MSRTVLNSKNRPIRWPRGDTLRCYRERRGLTQTEVAAALGIFQKSVSEWEIGYNTPRPHTIRRLADFLDIPISDLI